MAGITAAGVMAGVSAAATGASAINSMVNSGSGPGGSTQVGTQTNTQTNPTQTAQLPFLQSGWNSAQGMYNRQPGGIPYYPGQTLADVSPQTQAGINALTARSMYGSPVNTAATNYTTDVLNGNYLNAGNPYFSSMLGQTAQQLKPQVDTSFEGAGRYGSGASANAFADAMTRAGTNMAYTNYTNERANQQAMVPQAAGVANQGYYDINQLLNAGGMQRDLSQGYVNEDIARYQQNMQAPYTALSQYLSNIGQPTSGSMTQQLPIYGTSPTTNALNQAGNLFGNPNIQNAASGLWNWATTPSTPTTGLGSYAMPASNYASNVGLYGTGLQGGGV